MKLELDTNLPELWKESWPGEFEVFSHLEYCCGVPGALFLITTRKENGRPNACYHGWSSFTGDGRAFHAILPHIGLGTHTYANILREREFCVNFLPPSLHEACMRTGAHNDVETDEIQAAGLTAQTARLIKAPRIAEAFLSYECRICPGRGCAR
ncbi:MAG: flavin reductase [Clostridiales bacterium]|nr:flavin reductase [Clostridiales bacterium]